MKRKIHRIYTPKNGQLSQQKSVRRRLFSIKNLQFKLKGPTFDSDRGHLGGLDVRADQNDQKMNFEYSPPNLSMSNLGHPRTQEISYLWKFPNSQLYQKLNVRECWRINYLICISQFSFLGCPRLYTAYFCPVFVVLCTFA